VEDARLDDELRIRTTTEVIVEFRKFAASYSRYHDALVDLLASHSEVLRRKKRRPGEREFI
jgi:hypothetical protein